MAYETLSPWPARRAGLDAAVVASGNFQGTEACMHAKGSPVLPPSCTAPMMNRRPKKPPTNPFAVFLPRLPVLPYGSYHVVTPRRAWRTDDGGLSFDEDEVPFGGPKNTTICGGTIVSEGLLCFCQRVV